MSADQQYREKTFSTSPKISSSHPVSALKEKKEAADVLNNIIWISIVVICFLSLTVDLWYTKFPFFAEHHISEWMVGVGGFVVALLLFLLTPQFPQFMHYLKGVTLELRKIIWPTKNETIRMTWIVLLVVVVSAIFLSSMDWIFAKLIQTIIG